MRKGALPTPHKHPCIRPWCPKLTCNLGTLGEWIPLVVPVAHTNWYMVPHAAVGIDATQAGARVLALPTDAGLV